jgi:hypothetical protein
MKFVRVFHSDEIVMPTLVIIAVAFAKTPPAANIDIAPGKLDLAAKIIPKTIKDPPAINPMGPVKNLLKIMS